MPLTRKPCRDYADMVARIGVKNREFWQPSSMA
jgi:hypothetical protein